jgi:hypothetical protein
MHQAVHRLYDAMADYFHVIMIRIAFHSDDDYSEPSKRSTAKSLDIIDALYGMAYGFIFASLAVLVRR